MAFKNKRFKAQLLMLLLGSLLLSTPVQSEDFYDVQGEIKRLTHQGDAFNKVAKQGQAAVVSISSVHLSPKGPGTYSPLYEMFPNDMFEEFDENTQRKQKKKRLGSGVIVSKKGYILTNHHVIESVTDITITLIDGREFDAKVVGSDKETDLAVLKIDGRNLPTVKLGNSDKIKVGDWAIAVGNPFGLNGSVTVGIISATARSDLFDKGEYSNYIQTDAAINPGNSGGALLNVSGELVGINTAIYSQTGGYMGIGFSIPVNTAIKVMEDIIEAGHVVRGWLGLVIQPITQELKEEFKLPTRQGALVGDVMPFSPAEKEGIRRGDIITHFDGMKVQTTSFLKARLSDLKVGTKVKVKVLRNGKKLEFNIQLLESPDHRDRIRGLSMKTLGITAQEIDEKALNDYSLLTTEGLVVNKVYKKGLAYQKGMKVGDILIEMNDQYLDSIETFRNELEASDRFKLLIKRGGYTRYMLIEP